MRVLPGHPPGQAAPHHPQHARLGSLTPKERAALEAWFRALALAAYFHALWTATHGPTQWGAPAPVSSMSCPAGPVRDLIDQTFTIAAPWFESVAWRESNCRPEARNGSSGSAGIGQLLGHDDLLALVCPFSPPSESWADFRCNIEASWRLFVGSGTSPWRI